MNSAYVIAPLRYRRIYSLPSDYFRSSERRKTKFRPIMKGHLPSLNALRAFEAAARHQSITKAAEELHVTPAAVRHLVRNLEDDLGVKLLRRTSGRMITTEKAMADLKSLNIAFDLISEAASKLHDGGEWQTLTARVGPSLAASWLVPRLYRYKETNPNIELRLDATTNPVDFTSKDIDIAIGYGRDRTYSGLHAKLLFAQEIYPVCSPKLLSGTNALKQPDDLRHHTLLYEDWIIEDGSWPDWSIWLEAANVTGIEASRGPRFPQQSLATQAAAQGQGVALESTVLVDNNLLTGRLVRPFEFSLKTDVGIYIFCPSETIDTPKVAVFRDWLLAEMSR
jgi:LysR family glycine cleavage system transcriptional activator